MSSKSFSPNIVVGVGAVVWNPRNEVLLIRRANRPLLNAWSLPGGKVNRGETLRAALLRELREETGLSVEILALIDVAELVPGETADAADGHYVLIDFSARVISGHPVAGSDAGEVRWFTLEQVAQLPLWSETRRIIALSATRRD